MQVFRLVNGGSVDKMIAFDTLPESMMVGVRTKNCEGLPRYWAKWLSENGSIRKVRRCVETTRDAIGNYNYRFQDFGTEPCCFLLEYKDLNADKEKWQEICNFVRRITDVKTRLLDKVEDMAKPMAADCYVSIEIEPEDIPVIAIPKDVPVVEDANELIKPEEELVTPLPRRRGRAPKKIEVGA